MRVNIFEAGLVTFLLAGSGHMPTDDDTPKAGPDTQSWASVTQPPIVPPPVPARKLPPH